MEQLNRRLDAVRAAAPGLEYGSPGALATAS